MLLPATRIQEAARATGDMDLLVFSEQVKKENESGECIFKRRTQTEYALRGGSKWGRAYRSYLCWLGLQ